MREPNEIRVLATGFGAFPGARINASAVLAANIGRAGPRWERFGRVRVAVDTLPVVWREAGPALHALVARERPDILLLLGLAGGRTALSLETRALNRRSVLRPDARKRTAESSVLRHEGPLIRQARMPVARLVAAMRRAGAPARASRDAGDYLCNETLYFALESGAALVGFVHVPRPRDPFAPLSRRTAKPPRPALGVMTRALVALLPPLLAEHRARRGLPREAVAE